MRDIGERQLGEARHIFCRTCSHSRFVHDRAGDRCLFGGCSCGGWSIDRGTLPTPPAAAYDDELCGVIHLRVEELQ